MLFTSDWMHPPGEIVKTFWTQDDGKRHQRLYRDGHGDVLLPVPLPPLPEGACPGCGEPGRVTSTEISWCEIASCRVRGFETKETR